MGNKKRSKKTIPVLPMEIIIEILLKLPVISLLRCKSVCESWYSLISDTHFIKRHYGLSSSNINHEHHRLITNPHKQRNNLNSFPLSDLLFDKSVSNVLELENPLQRAQPRALTIAGCCNGLICLVLENDDDYNLFIYNPSTRIWNELPFRRRKSRHGWHAEYSFGYDESSDDYKVVEMSTLMTFFRGQIYSVKTGNWKRLGKCSYAIYSDSPGEFSNGALHWLTYERHGSSFTQRIVSLDLAKETYGEVLQPEYDEGDKTFDMGVFVVLGEWLCVLCDYRESRADVWAMKVYGVKDSWTKLVSNPHQTDIGWLYVTMPMFISNDEKVLLRYWLKLVVYDCKNNSGSEIQNFDSYRKACIVVESLISPFPALDHR